jgi:hypothetical protein
MKKRLARREDPMLRRNLARVPNTTMKKQKKTFLGRRTKMVREKLILRGESGPKSKDKPGKNLEPDEKAWARRKKKDVIRDVLSRTNEDEG